MRFSLDGFIGCQESADRVFLPTCYPLHSSSSNSQKTRSAMPFCLSRLPGFAPEQVGPNVGVRSSIGIDRFETEHPGGALAKAFASGHPKTQTIAQLLIDLEESPHSRAVVLGELRKRELRGTWPRVSTKHGKGTGWSGTSGS